MAHSIKIALDAMGGDIGPTAVIPAAQLTAKEFPNVQFIIFGNEALILPLLAKHKILRERATVVHTEKFISSDEKPSIALRNGKGTSMRMAIEAVRDGKADAVVSAGNTGALMATAKTVLKTLPGIHRPAIASLFPGKNGPTVMLDLGANVLVDAENLVQFAVLGSVFAKAHKKITVPSVGLLNVGTEETKGPDHVKGAASILSRIDFPGKYKGFVEGTDIMAGNTDVIVCDGYAGNIALKAVEGTGKMIFYRLKDAFKSDPLAMIGAFFATFALKKFRKKIDPRYFNGGVFLGLNGICVKSHGGSDDVGISTAINLACSLATEGYISSVSRDISHLMSQESLLAEAAYRD